MEALTIDLDEPIEHGKQTIDSLTMREPRIGDLRGLTIGAEKIEFDTLITLAARMARVPPKVIEGLSGDAGAAVMQCATDALGKFLGDGDEP